MGREIIAVPGRRFRTLINLTENGFNWKTGSQSIDFIVCDKNAVYHVTKYDKIRVFDPKLVQDFDGYKVNVRVYHDVFVPDNKRVGIYAHVSESTIPTPTIKFIYNADTDTLSNIAVIPGDIMIDGLYAVSASESIRPVGTDLSNGLDIAISSGFLTKVGAYTPTGLAAGTYYLLALRNGVIVAENATETFTVVSSNANPVIGG